MTAATPTNGWANFINRPEPNGPTLEANGDIYTGPVVGIQVELDNSQGRLDTQLRP